jgi:glycosyltransferase involved in cell wall biosynthesis
MKILLCSQADLTKQLGASKNVIELAEALENLGWQCDLLSPKDLSSEINDRRSFAIKLRQYLITHAGEYDVVDYDHASLPYARAEFNPKTLFVARVFLLAQHFENIKIAIPNNLRGKIGFLLKGRSRQAELNAWISDAVVTTEAADLINVSNDDDRTELIRRGIADHKICVVPLGISQILRPLFDQVSSAIPPQPIVAFVGAFDTRKGSNDFPEIVKLMIKAIPNIKFLLLGAKYKNEKQVLEGFNRQLRNYIEVIPTFAPEALPELLAPCTVGIFPSYIEGFGFGVLEMLAASIPVIAYDAPGPPMMLPPDYLVPRGDIQGMATKLIALLQDHQQLAKARIWAKMRSQSFTAQRTAELTNQIYLKFRR